jgi:serine/threonine protein kinase/tetratricopeptide (TPR) repeat protein
LETHEAQDSKVREVCSACGEQFAEGTAFCPADGTELVRTMADPMIGVILPRRYRIMSLLGRGAMSVVYKGTYEPLDQLVAIKIMKSHLVSDPGQLKRFQQEIKTAGGLEHPNIVGILDFGVTDQGVPYLIMEYLQGQSLADIIAKEGRLSVNRAIRIFTQAADALGYAHREKGLIHRDIKPSNVVVIDTEDETDVVKIVDFGIAKVQSSGTTTGGHGQQNLTATGDVLGTPLYMSPEQSMGKDIDSRSDIYSLGCVMYESITGRPPFVGDTAIDTIRKQITASALPLDTVRPDLYIPERLQGVINKALVKDRKHRYQRMDDLKNDLEAMTRKPESSATPLSVVPMEQPREQLSSGDEAKDKLQQLLDKAKTVKYGSLPVIAGMIAGVFIVGVGIWALTIRTDVKPGVPAEQQTPVIAKKVTAEELYKKHSAAGTAAFDEGNFDQAEMEFIHALNAAEEIQAPKGGNNDLKEGCLAETLNEIAAVYYNQDRLEEAQEACNRSLNIRKNLNEPIADNLNNLALIASASGDEENAISLAKQALSMREKDLGPADPDVAASLKTLAKLECREKNFAAARDLLSRALAIDEKAVGAESPTVASILQDLAMVYERQGNYGKAEKLYKRALGIRQQKLGLQHPSTADTLVALGTLNFNKRKDTEAETMFSRALDIRKKAFGEDNSRTAEVLTCLAILYDNTQKYKKAENCYRQAFEIRQKLWGPESPRLLRSLKHLSKFLRERNQVHGAEVYEAQIKKIEEKNNS